MQLQTILTVSTPVVEVKKFPTDLSFSNTYKVQKMIHSQEGFSCNCLNISFVWAAAPKT